MFDIIQLIQQCAPNVEPTTMLRIIGVESAQRPHAIGYKITRGGVEYRLTKQPVNTAEATSWATWLVNNGYRFDAGIAQVNSSNFATTGLNAVSVFDACKNIEAGGKILGQFYAKAVTKYGQGQTALYAAISAYQSGNFYTGFATGYVQKVTSPRALVGKMPPLALGGALIEQQEINSDYIQPQD